MVRSSCRICVIAACAACAACGGDDPGDPACGDPLRGPRLGRFSDVSTRSGVDFEYAWTGFEGGGLAVVDLDGDGLPEIVAGRRGGGLALFHNLGGLRFAARPDAGLDPAAAASAIGAADLDNDGDLDLVIAGGGIARVLANRGGGSFAEVARLDDPGAAEHVLPVDLDGDGLLDLYLSDRDVQDPASSRDRLYLNRGGLQLAPAPALAGAGGAGLSWSATALDFDGDGDLDLYVANDTLVYDTGKPRPSVPPPWPVDLLLRNDGPGPDGAPRLTDVAAAVGLATPRSSMGGLYGDFAGDGRLGLYVPDYGAKKLFVRDPDGQLVDRAGELGLAAIERRSPACDGAPGSPGCLVLTWSAALADLDLDGSDEVLLVNGATAPGDAPPVLGFTRGDGIPYREVAPELSCLDARGLAVTDLDGDGDPDVVIARQQGPLAIYENRGAPPPTAWLRVTLRGRVSNRDGAGAIVTARLSDGRTLTRAVGAGGVAHTALPAEAVFGLGDAEAIALEVRWPSGRRTSVARPAGPALVLDEDP